MYESNEPNVLINEQIVFGKKKAEIDDDGPVSKKAQKNKWKKQKKLQRDEADIEEFQQVKPVQRKTMLTQEEKYEIMVSDLKTLVGCGQSLIRQKLKEANYNKEMALNLILNKLEDDTPDMMDLFDKKEENTSVSTRSNNSNSTNNNNNPKSTNKKSNQKQSNHQVEEQAYKLLNEICEKSEIEISGFEFEQLFNEITEIIKEDQKQRGRGVIEINNFVETCMSAKDTILVGLKDVFKVDADIEFDENDPVHIQLQNFIYEDTQKQVQQQVINKEEFPSLGENSKKKNNTANNKNSTNNSNPNNNKQQQKYQPQKSSIVNQLQNENRHTNGPIRKQDLFRPCNNRPVMFTEKNSIFNVDNQLQSEDALRELHKEYNFVSIYTLKIVYLTLDKNFHQCRTFLERYYPKEKEFEKKVSLDTNIFQRREVSIYQPKVQTRRHYLAAFRKETYEEIDQELQRWTLNELRSEIEHLYNLRQVFHMTCKNITSTKQRQQLMRIADDSSNPALIGKLSKASRVKLIEETMRFNPNYIDLHGYRQDEIGPIMESMIASIRENFDRGNEKVKSKTINGRAYALVQIMTGKGRHSQYGRSILKPCVKQWCESHEIRTTVNEDNVEIYIPLV